MGEVLALGMCRLHYGQWRAQLEMSPVDPASNRNAWGEKQCSECERWLNPEMDFPGERSKKCRMCREKWGSGKARPSRRRAVTAQLLEAQGGRCAICPKELSISQPGPSGPNLDHDHACCKYGCEKCYRGVLCARCNTALGQFRDSIGDLLGSVIYLTAWEVKKEQLMESVS